MRQISLTQGYVALVDEEDYNNLVRYRWHIHVSGNHISARANIGTNTARNDVYMHRFILGITDPKVQVDHEDGNPLNNQKSNLRIATSRQNAMNKRKTVFKNSKNKKSKYKGVCWYRWKNKWVVHVANKYIGYFESEEDAAKAYNVAAKRQFGEFAKLNSLEV